MKQKQLFFPLMLRLGESANYPIPISIVEGLVSQYDPQKVNTILAHYQMCSFWVLIKDACISCGRELFGTKSQTCSERCYKISIRHDQTPFQLLQEESEERLQAIKLMASKGNPKKVDWSNYNWLKITNGWKYTSCGGQYAE